MSGHINWGHTWSTQFLVTLDFVSKSVPSPVFHILTRDVSQPNQVTRSTHFFVKTKYFLFCLLLKGLKVVLYLLAPQPPEPL